VSEPVLPTFVIGGAPRCGTTFLCQTLDTHPDVTMASPYVPEPKVMVLPAPSIDAYRERYRPYFGAEHADRARGEKTTLYFESSEAPDLFDRVVPGAKMIFLLREPVGRAYSNWLWSRKNGLEDLSFADAIELEGRPRPTRLPDWQAAYARPHDYLARNDYAGFARRWLDAIGPDRARFYLYEDLVGPAGAALLEEIQRFIGVAPQDLAPPADRPTAAHDTGPPIDPAVEARLRERMRPRVEEFATLTDTDVSPWGY
jgi:Sulfotransferase family